MHTVLEPGLILRSSWLKTSNLIRCHVLEWLIQSDNMHGKSKNEYRKHGQKSSQILHEIADDDSPRAEQMMKR